MRAGCQGGTSAVRGVPDFARVICAVNVHDPICWKCAN